MTTLANLQAPSLDDFEVLAQDAYARLPEEFRQLCEGVVIRVEDFPDDETMQEMGCETPFDLLGLFRGIGLAQGGAMMQTGQFPNMVWLYRRPILDYWAEHEETLSALVKEQALKDEPAVVQSAEADILATPVDEPAPVAKPKPIAPATSHPLIVMLSTWLMAWLPRR